MKTVNHLFRKCLIAAMLPATFGLWACFEDIDESDLYTFTGETIEDYLANRPEQFSDFNYILSRTGYDKILSSYGVYTCFAPGNEAVQHYIDSLYDDETNVELPHNGMTQRGLEGLTDSLCNDIALYHLLYTKLLSVNMSKGTTISTILKRDINTTTDSLGVAINVNTHLLTNIDIELENGVLHEIDHVFTRSNNFVSGELERHPEFSIILDALNVTGLADTLTQTTREGVNYPESDPEKCYIPEECKVGFTLFAESNDVLQKEGIESVEDLAEYARQVYENCARVGSGWYDYYRNNGITVSTGTDYHEANNVLNMFIRYHIVRTSIPTDHLVYEKESNCKSPKCPAINYFETMLPYTLVRLIYQNGRIYANRWTENFSLTDQVGDLGTPGMHPLRDPGVEISSVAIQALNGYIHPIKSMLLYKANVPQGVLKERMRFDDAAILHELLTNKLRHVEKEILGGMNPGGLNTKVRIPDGWCENLIIYNGEQSRVKYLPIQGSLPYNAWTSWESDEVQAQGKYDIALRLPPVPDGIYEIRMGYQAIGGTGTGNRGMMQIFLGDGTYDQASMVPLGIPLDMRKVPSDNGQVDVTTGWIKPSNTDDEGVETDIAMRYLGYMRGSLGQYTMNSTNTARSKNNTLRRILAKVTLHQGEYWLRFKSVLEDETPMLHLDYLELVPEDVFNNETYSEDMY